MGHIYKDGLIMDCHISFKSIIWSLLTVVNFGGLEWVGSFLKNFQKGGEGTI